MEVIHNNLDELTTVTPADWVHGPEQGNWTYDAYAALTDDGECYEIVQGVLVMSPAPSGPHQGVTGEIYTYLREQILLKRLGLVFTAPFDVALSEQNVFQPDVVVLLKEHLAQYQEKKIIGAPDLLVEVISPSSKLYDRALKHMIYEQAGVPEYWLVDEKKQTIELFALEGAKYHACGIYKGQQILPSRIVPQIDVSVAFFFDWSKGLV
jgi:Uma2 family endonuclease